MTGLGPAPGRTVGAEDVGDVQSWTQPPSQAGGGLSFKRSSGLSIPSKVLAATWV
jgi:hypothetical protein